jgi:hypothetical protein
MRRESYPNLEGDGPPSNFKDEVHSTPESLGEKEIGEDEQPVGKVGSKIHGLGVYILNVSSFEEVLAGRPLRSAQQN